MSRDQDIEADSPDSGEARGLGGLKPEDGTELSPPVSPFTTAPHRIASEAGTDEREARMKEARRQAEQGSGE